ncbi:MAG: family 10 glycosylhydrolase [Roseburia sp.]|nr:family 10 glycosylhydrolase [Roseburia sp.]
MRSRSRFYVAAFFLTVLLYCFGNAGTAHAKEVRAVWVSFYEYEGAGLKNQPEAAFRANADKMFRNIRDNGCNTVFFHVRAFDDAIWPSENFDFSSYMGSEEPDYDPLAILVEAAHKYDLSFHAWMNPYRITKQKVYDPAEKSTNSRILLAVHEVIDKYPVDGIHFDDYFYPSKGHKQYSKYSSVSKKKKMEYTNAMVQSVYNAVKQKSDSLQFGISPAGNVEYCETIGADVKTWMSTQGYIDYIVPQIYWSNSYLLGGRMTKLFDQRLSQWKSLNTAGVTMYIGLGLYRGGMSDRLDTGWKKSSKVVASEISKTRRSSKVSGYALFSYESLYKNSCQKEVKNLLKRISTVKISADTKTLKRGSKMTLRASVWPLRLGQSVEWRSSNKKIATVSRNGVVKAKKKGTVRIRAVKGNKKVSIKLRIE